MKKFLGKILLYGVLMALVMEVLVRAFQLYFQYPVVTLDENQIVHYIPGQQGIFNTGNRRMNTARYRINQAGFNSFREFEPTRGDFEVALIGDSFIEGLHQDFDNSIGKMIELGLDGRAKVFEYGFSGYDLADQLHLMHQLREEMKRIDLVFIYLNFDDDITRDHYTVNTRASLENNIAFKIKREMKLLSFLNGIGLMAPLLDLPSDIRKALTGEKPDQRYFDPQVQYGQYIENLDALLRTYPIDRDKSVFLLDESITDGSFMEYCRSNGYSYLDFGRPLRESTENTVLKFDPIKHWNDHGRSIMAEGIIDYMDANGVLAE